MSQPETMRFICGGCGYRARIPTSYAGKVILCPGCQQMQIATADAGEATGDTVRVTKVATAPGTARFSVPEADGRLRFTCNACGYSAKLATTYAGKAISCPQCKSPQLIPPLSTPENHAGKSAPPSAPGPTADDALTFDDEPAAKKPAAAAPREEISFEREAAAPASPPAGRAARPAEKPAPPSTRPGSGGVVRRGSRMAMPAAPQQVEEPDEDVEPPARPVPPWVAAAKERLRQPRVLALLGGGLAALILLTVLINGWLSASADAEDFRTRFETADAKARQVAQEKADLEFAHSKLAQELARHKQGESEAKAALAASETRLAELNDQLKKSETERAAEYAQRKKAEADHDEVFAKLKAVEKKRDEEYRIATEMRRKYEEEAKLRKDLKQRFDELQAASK